MAPVLKGIAPYVDADAGAIVVYCGRKTRTKAISAFQSEATTAYGPPPTYNRNEYPTEREFDGNSVWVAIFEDVPPGRVRVSTIEKDHWNVISREVSVRPNAVTEVDFR
jgi:hypothetical protein